MKGTAKEVKESIISIVENKMSEFLNGAEYLSKIEFTGKNGQWLFLFLEEGASLQQGTNNVTFTMRFLDVAAGRSNQQDRDIEIKSDMIQAASILLQYLQADEVLVVDVDTSFTPIYVTYGDGLSGIQLSVTFPIEKPCVI